MCKYNFFSILVIVSEYSQLFIYLPPQVLHPHCSVALGGMMTEQLAGRGSQSGQGQSSRNTHVLFNVSNT